MSTRSHNLAFSNGAVIMESRAAKLDNAGGYTQVSYVPITINRKSLTIMGVAFPDSETLETTADAIGSNMFKGLFQNA